VDSYVQKVQALVASHQSSLSRLNSAVNASAQNLAAGGTYYLCCGDTAFISEAYGRAGGSMAVTVYLGQTVGFHDVIWASYSAGTYQSTAATIAAMNAPAGAVIVWFGPLPPSGAPSTYWIDSLTQFSDEDDFTLTGNLLSLWEMTGELGAATARLGRTLVFWESGELPSATARNAHYTNQMFHSGWPQMSPLIPSGTLSASYLTYISNMIAQIAQIEVGALVSTGQLVAKRLTGGSQSILGVVSHAARYPPVLSPTPYFKFYDGTGTSPLTNFLTANQYVVYLGYYGLDREAFRAVRNTAGSNATWIQSPEPHMPDVTYWGDVSINAHWDFGDAAVPVPGYDVSLMPASGISQLFMYDLIIKSAAAAAVTTPPPTVAIVAPAQNATVTGTNVTVSATAAAAGGLTIASIQIKLDNANLGSSCLSSPCSVTLNATTLSTGSHQLTAVATDSAGSTGTAATVTINVPGPPVVAITTPAANATVYGSGVTVSATATAAGGLTISSLQVKLDGANLGASCSASPCSATLNTTALSSGPHQLTAVATDSSNATSNSAAVAVNVPTPPTVSITAPAANAAVSGSAVTVIATATPYSGLTIASIQIKLDNANMGASCLSSPCSASLNASTLSLGSHSLTATATDSAGLSATSAPVSITVAATLPPPVGSPLVTAQSLGPVRNNQTQFVGMQFTPKSSLTVTSLGRFCLSGNSQSHTVKLVTASSGADLPGGTASVAMNGCAPNKYQYATLATPVTLQAGTPYILVSGEVTGGDTWYDYAPVTAINQVSVDAAIYSAGSQFVQVPAPGYSYVPVNLLYATNLSVSITAPSAGATLNGVTTFTATATNATSVQFQINGNNAGSPVSGSGPTYNLSYDTSLLANGTYQLAAIASGGGSTVTSASVGFTVNHVYSSPTGVGAITGYNLSATRNNFSGFIGMQFTVGCAPVTVTGLGRLYLSGNNGVHTVKLVRASDGTDLPGASVNIQPSLGTAGQFTYAAFASPVTLSAGSSYYLVSQEASGGDLFYDYGPVSILNIGVVNGPIYQSVSTWNGVSAPGDSYGPLDLLLAIPGGLPAPVMVTGTPVTHTPGVSPAGINHVLITGQSLAIGYAGSPALTTTQPYSNVTLNSPYAAFTPLVEGSQALNGNVETIGSALGNTMTSLSTGQSYVAAVTNDGRNGLSYAQMAKGTAPYADGIAQLTAAKGLAQTQGTLYRVAAIAAVHGETDQGTGISAAAFEADMVQWQQNYQADAQAISGQTTPVPLFLDQVSSWGYSQLAVPTVALGQLAAAEDQPGSIVMVGPKYQYHYADGIHLDNLGYRQEGEQFGKVMKQVLVDGAPWKPLSPKTIARSGTSVTVQFNVPQPPLRFDTTTVLPKNAMGFEYSDGSACSPYITSAQITAADTVTLTLSGLPNGASESVRYAYTTAPGSFSGKDQPGAARGNLKDSDGTHSLYGNDLSNWAVSFNKPVGTGAVTNPPPTVSITLPAAGVSLSGTASFGAIAAAASGLTIASVQFQVNGSNAGAALVGSGQTFTANLSFDTTTLANGAYQLTAIAKDSASGTATSGQVAFSVSNAAPVGTPFITGFTPSIVRNNFNGFVGMQFSVGARSIKLSSLGRMCLSGNSGTHLLKLVSQGGADLAGGSVTVNMAGCTPGQYQYAALPATVNLSANTAYYLMSQETNSDTGYDYSHVSSTSAATVLAAVYVAGGQYLGVPIFYGDPAYCYVPLNFLYQ
jgi:hypothetical protein